MHEVLIIEDNERIASLIERGLDENGYRPSVAYDGLSGHKLATQHRYDLIITDIVLPKMSGIDLCKSLKQQRPEVPIIMLTALGTTDDKMEGFDAGADDYLVKPFEMRELVARTRVLIRRYSLTQGNAAPVLHFADLEMNLHSKTVKRQGVVIDLTPKEFKLLEYFLLHPERVLSRSEIAAKVWDTHFDTGTNFIDVYINYLRRKIDRPFDPKLIHTKPGMGFILKTDED